MCVESGPAGATGRDELPAASCSEWSGTWWGLSKSGMLLLPARHRTLAVDRVPSTLAYRAQGRPDQVGHPPCHRGRAWVEVPRTTRAALGIKGGAEGGS